MLRTCIAATKSNDTFPTQLQLALRKLILPFQPWLHSYFLGDFTTKHNTRKCSELTTSSSMFVFLLKSPLITQVSVRSEVSVKSFPTNGRCVILSSDQKSCVCVLEIIILKICEICHYFCALQRFLNWSRVESPVCTRPKEEILWQRFSGETKIWFQLLLITTLIPSLQWSIVATSCYQGF